MNPKDRRGRPDTVGIVEVIQCNYAKGDGTEGNPVRACSGFWAKDGRFLWEIDPLALEEQAKERAKEEQR